MTVVSRLNLPEYKNDNSSLYYILAVMVSKGADLDSIMSAISENESRLLLKFSDNDSKRRSIRIEADNLRSEVRSIFINYPFFIAKHRNSSLKFYKSDSDDGDMSILTICLNNKAEPKKVLSYMIRSIDRDKVYSSVHLKFKNTSDNAPKKKNKYQSFDFDI